MLSIAAKDLRLLSRDRPALVWVLVLPLLIAILFGFMSASGGKLRPIALTLIDEDGGRVALAFRAALESEPALRVLEKSRAEAMAAVRRGDQVAVLILPPGFGAALFQAESNAEALLLIDPARRAERGVLDGLVMKAFANAGEEMAQSAGTGLPLALAPPAGSIDQRTLDALTDRTIDLPSLIAKPPKLVTRPLVGGSGLARNGFEISFPVGMTWGLIACAAAFAVSIARERSGGMLLRLRCAPIDYVQILGGKAIACFAACVAEMAILCILAAALFEVRIEDPVALFVAVLCTAACFVGLMTLLAQAGRSEMAVNGASWAVLLIFAMFGGAMVPTYLMPGWMESAGQVSPVSWAIQALEGATWRGLRWSELVRPLGVMLVFGAVTFGIGLLAMAVRRQN